MASSRTLFDGPVRVEYAQMYVMSPVEFRDDVPERRQRNGLCDAVLPGFLWLTTATHTGTVPLRVEPWEEQPGTDDAWEDVVEASFEPLTDEVALVQWAGEARFPLALPRGRCAVRYSASLMDAARESEAAGEAPPDRYLLQFWPSDDVELDRVIREGSRFAAMVRAQRSGT